MAGLTTGQSAGNQAATQNPQAVPTQTVGASAQTGSVQPGTATSLLTGGQGVSLANPALATVSLAASTQSPQDANQPARHSVNPAWLIIPVVLCLIAAWMFWAMRRSAKSTTD